MDTSSLHKQFGTKTTEAYKLATEAYLEMHDRVLRDALMNLELLVAAMEDALSDARYEKEQGKGNDE